MNHQTKVVYRCGKCNYRWTSRNPKPPTQCGQCRTFKISPITKQRPWPK